MSEQPQQSLVERLIPVNSRMSALADRLGIPTYQNVVMVSGGVQTLLLPRPKVLSMSQRDVINFMANSVDVNQDDRWISDIPRDIPVETLANSRFILNATQAPNGTWVGINTDKPIWIDRNGLMTYKLLVRVLRGR